jgi:TrpR-related protein YerC/YecD
MSKLKNPLNEALLETILKIETLEEAYAFFEDLCTIKEVDTMAQRLYAANLLLQGKTYEQIIQETHISSTTLSRVSTCVRYGTGGYARVLIKKNKK